ncbi:MAG: ATP-binding cassette domain-containing protein [Granulosicoccus sp.]
MDALRVKNLNISVAHQPPMVSDLNFDIEAGDVLALMGASGSGKSSVLGWLTGTLNPYVRADGQAWLGDVRVDALPTERRRLGLMLQQDYLFPHMSVGDNLRFGLRDGTRQNRTARILEILDSAGLQGMENRDPATLSGGQRARVSLLRTLLSDPCALLLDEPFSRLDTARREQIRQFTWHSARKLPVLLVTHDVADVPEGASIITIGSAPADGEVITSPVPG